MAVALASCDYLRMRGSQAGYDGGLQTLSLPGLCTELADMGAAPEAYTLTVLECRIGDPEHFMEA